MDRQTAIIIGAGPAGLTAGYELLTETNIKPVIFEMTGDIGGISKTVDYKGNRIDFQIIDDLHTMGGKKMLSLLKINHLIPYGVFAVSTYLLGVFLPSASSGSYSEQLHMMSMETIATNATYYMILPSAFFTGSIPEPFVVIFTKPRTMSLYTQRKSILLIKIEGILASPERYIACRRNGLFDMILQGCGASVRKVFQNGRFIIYRKQDARSAAREGYGGLRAKKIGWRLGHLTRHPKEEVNNLCLSNFR